MKFKENESKYRLEQLITILTSCIFLIKILETETKDYELTFPKRIVKVAYTNKTRLKKLVKKYPYIAKISDATAPDDFYLNQNKSN